MMSILVTGGAGFLGSHTCLSLLEHGYNIIILDDLSRGHYEAIRRVRSLSMSMHYASSLQFVRGSICNPSDLNKAFTRLVDIPSAVIHFAGLKSVSESIREPLRYWHTNFIGTLNLLNAMKAFGCRTLVFSSSATVYGSGNAVPIPENAPIIPINPYGKTKSAVESLFADLIVSCPDWRIASLRYFNPVGAHSSGHIGEDPFGEPSNLFPYITQVAMGKRAELKIFGNDWPTPDGTCIRDYIHVMDLAEGHIAALKTLLAEPPQLLTVNLGSGHGHSVLELVHAFEAATGLPVPYKVVERRPGDAASTVADPRLAHTRLGWRTSRYLVDICRDGWAWQQANPEGYGKE